MNEAYFGYSRYAIKADIPRDELHGTSKSDVRVPEIGTRRKHMTRYIRT